LSALFDLPSGAVIVWTLAVCAIVFVAVLRPSRVRA
jgi:zinc/manganese transport system permease protein